MYFEFPIKLPFFSFWSNLIVVYFESTLIYVNYWPTLFVSLSSLLEVPRANLVWFLRFFFLFVLSSLAYIFYQRLVLLIFDQILLFFNFWLKLFFSFLFWTKINFCRFLAHVGVFPLLRKMMSFNFIQILYFFKFWQELILPSIADENQIVV